MTPMTQPPPGPTLDTIRARISSLEYPSVDGVVAVERGGTAPAELVAAHLDVPLGRVRVRFRHDDHSPMSREPVIEGVPEIPHGSEFLLVDDVSVTGATLRVAAAALGDVGITTMVMRGTADLVVFTDIDGCVTWPWSE